jgi:uncharacterized protein
MPDETNILNSGRIKKSASFVLVVLAVFLIVKTINTIREYKFIGGGVPTANTITISGEGEVFAVPDIAEFSFSVVEERKVVKDAQDAAAEKINAIIAYLKDNGIEEKDIKTTNYSVYPRYEFEREACPLGFNCPPGKQVLKGFEVNQSISVKVRDTEKAGEILSGIGERGVSNVSGLDFTIDDEDELLRQARKEAIDKAREKAKELAGDLGVRLVRVVSFSESGGQPFFSRLDFAVESVGIGKTAPAPEIPVGENKITSVVSITYEIR